MKPVRSEAALEALRYPDSDGRPMADNQTNARRMVDTDSALREAFRRRGESDRFFVGYDLLVYPVEGDIKICNAPDVFVAPGSAQAPDRTSFLCWREARVDFAGEFLSPVKEERYGQKRIDRRIAFYRDRLATTELFIYEPLGPGADDGFLFWLLRLGEDGDYHEVEPDRDGWYRSVVIPLEIRPIAERVQVRNARTGEEYLPDSLRADQETARANQEAARAEQEKARADQEKARADHEKARADALEAELARLRRERDRG